MGQGGARHPELRARLIADLEPDLLFVQETRDPTLSWLPVLPGDFNVAVGLRRPEHPPALSRGEQALLERLRDELGLIACWQTAHPSERLARTLRWMHRSDSLPYHCDGIFVPAEWASALKE